MHWSSNNSSFGQISFGNSSLAFAEILSLSLSFLAASGQTTRFEAMDVFFSDFDSYSDSSSSDDQERNEFMYGGQASCILSNLEETIGKIDDFLLFERGYVHGDIIFATNNPSRQMGKVIGIDITVDLENVHGNKLKDINSKNLERIRSISPGDYVVNGSWIGKIEKIVDFVTILFDDATKFEFTTMEDEKNIKIIPLSQDFLEDSQYPYYPGQRVKVMISSRSKSTRWFFGTQNRNYEEGTVCAVRAGSVYVNWLGCASFGSEKTRAPQPLQSSKDLIFLSCFSHSSWQLGDWCTMSKTHENPQKLPQNNTINPKFQPSFQEIYVIEKMKTKVDVLWQDGSESYGVDSNSLAPVNVIDAHDFWPHQFVLEKGTFDDQENRKWGVVKSFDATEKTVVVKWENSSKIEIVSAYELIEHPDYSLFHGDLVFRMNEEHACCIGIVIGFENGEIEVKWASGFISKVAPHEISRVEKTEGISTDENLEPNQEKSEHDNHTVDSGEKDLLDFDGDDNDCLKSLCDSTTFNVPRAAIGFISSVAARLFGSPYTSLSAASDHVSENGSRSDFDFEEDSQMFVETYLESKVNKLEEFNDVNVLSCGKNPKEVKQFDVVSDCSNHHFVDGAGKGLILSQVKRGWLKKVQQEWKILGKDLPESIYVRVFEERMDLLRAAIVGAPGTPYHDGLFFFDIFLPPQYPHEPPMVHYNSGGLRVNPNLYESGKICLSLLNTWSGTGTETWNPDGSTILQVLVSLQALVLNQKPYFNEAGYDRQLGSAEGEKNSRSYNENAFLMSCKSMIYTLRNPPKHFEALVDEHFAERYKCILMACNAYLEGVPIGCAFANEYVDPKSQNSNSCEPGGQKSNSTGFKIMLSKLVPKIVEAFTEKGINCGEFAKMGDGNCV